MSFINLSTPKTDNVETGKYYEALQWVIERACCESNSVQSEIETYLRTNNISFTFNYEILGVIRENKVVLAETPFVDDVSVRDKFPFCVQDFFGIMSDQIVVESVVEVRHVAVNYVKTFHNCGDNMLIDSLCDAMSALLLRHSEYDDNILFAIDTLATTEVSEKSKSPEETLDDREKIVSGMINAGFINVTEILNSYESKLVFYRGPCSAFLSATQKMIRETKEFN